MQIASQCCIDIGNHIISVKKTSFPGGYGEIFVKLNEIGVIDEKTSKKMSRIAGFRNILVHDYLKVDHEIVFDNLQDLGVFIDFVNQVNQSIKDSN